MRLPVLLSLIIFIPSPAIAGYPQSFIYPHPIPPEYQTGDQDLSCTELDRQLSELEPLTYTNKPRFYEDPAHGAAIWGGFYWPPVWGYFAYSGLVEYQDQRRIIESSQRIDVLRRLKTKRHCYEG